MSLSQEPVFTELKTDFVCGTKDITGAPWSGVSGIHPMTGGAVTTTNGAGPHNLQLFVLAQDGTVLTCLPGYWNPDDLALELDLAKQLNKVWTDKSLTLSQKRAKFTEMQLAHIQEHPIAMVRRSQMQGFDKKFEQKSRLATSDTVYAMTGGKNDGPVFKTTDQIFHERLAKQPFVPYSQFDVVAFSDYGRPLYNKKEEGSLPPIDLRAQAVEKRQRMEQMRALRQQRMLRRRGGGG